MLSGGRFFEYRKEDITRFVTILFDKGEKEIAIRICNRYLEVGLDFLIPVLRCNLDK
jgi:hypothetical protein